MATIKLDYTSRQWKQPKPFPALHKGIHRNEGRSLHSTGGLTRHLIYQSQSHIPQQYYHIRCHDKKCMRLQYTCMSMSHVANRLAVNQPVIPGNVFSADSTSMSEYCRSCGHTSENEVFHFFQFLAICDITSGIPQCICQRIFGAATLLPKFLSASFLPNRNLWNVLCVKLLDHKAVRSVDWNIAISAVYCT